MAGHLVKSALVLILILVVAFCAWFFRPWSEYSPFTLIWERETGDRIAQYREFDQLFPHRTVEGADDAADLPRRLQDINETYEWQGEEKTLDQYAAESDTTALMIVKDGAVVFERYYNGETAESRHTSWSVAKSYIATLIGIALKEGRIASLDDTVATYVPEFTGTDFGETSLKNLLMMSSGIDFIEDYETRGSDMRKLFFNVFIMNADIDDFVKPYERDRDPATDFYYISPNSHVLSMVLREVYDRPLAETVSEKIFKPLGMANATWVIDRNAKDGKEIGYCCLQSRAEDYARFGMLYVRGGAWDGEQILPEGWVERVGTPQTEFHEPGNTIYGDYGYGLHFWIPPGTDGVILANGFNGQSIWIDTVRDVVVVRTAADEQQIPRREETTVVMKVLASALD